MIYFLYYFMQTKSATSTLVILNKASRPHDLWWMVDLSRLDFEYYLPIFCDALSDTEYPFNILARDGAIELLEAAGDRVLRVLPEVVSGIKKAINTEIPEIMMNACSVIQKLATVSPLVGTALIKYYRVLLIPFFSKYKTVRSGFKEGEIDYGQRKRNLGTVIDETLDLLDRTGGQDAYVEIKYAVPTFESVYHNA
ncbi:parkin coregulated gene protein homolog isoform X2 [Stegodyphus dumicola]|uniref:parkin coregulated gene protein homolog isoform X2 n=1 Tax=Stegodyphus dumicola TaxID=202533 RepID=UPI0015AAC092|nr:parkin coregulated gene protein homolog isoform X2 [Stegodyphus dumicola]